jgi:hypothetical protein
MTWVKLDDGFHGHPKVLAAGLAASGLFARALSYCGAYLTDGRVPSAWVAAQLLDESDDLAQRLVDVGLWRRDGTAYVIPDFTDLNPSKVQVEQQRAEGAERARKSRERRQKGGRS